MKISSSKFNNSIIETHYLKIGTFYFFENLVIAEINEGIHIDLKSSQPFFKLANNFYGDIKPFGYVSNRIHQFSVSPIDFANYSLKLENIKSFCAITYNSYFDKMNIEIEKRFFTKPFYSTYGIGDAINWTNAIVNGNNKAIA